MTRAQRQQLEATIRSLEANARFFRMHDKPVSAERCERLAAERRERLRADALAVDDEAEGA